MHSMRAPLQNSEDSRPDGRGVLVDLIDSVSTIGVASHPENLDQIWESSPEHAKILVCVLEDIPRTLIQPIVECVGRLCDESLGASTPQTRQLCRVARHLGTDPRSYREAVRTLETLQRVTESDLDLEALLDRCLVVLDNEGVLGMRRIRSLSRFLRALDRRPGTLVLHDRTLSAGDDDLSVGDLHELHRQMGHHSALWGPRAACEVLHPQSEGFGAIDKVSLPVRGTLVVDEPSMALVPSEETRLAWTRIDPIPKALTVDDPAEELQPYMHLQGDLRDPVRASTLDVLYLGLRVVDSIVQKQWMHRVRLFVRLHDESGNRACYRPDVAELHLWRGPLSAWSVVHELAHVIDDQLFDGPGLASEQHGHPLASFAAIVRPLYQPVAERQANHIWAQMLEANFDGSLAAAASTGQTVPLEEVLDAVSWPVPSWRGVAQQLIAGDTCIDPVTTDRAFGEPMGPGAYRLLNTLRWGLTFNEQGEPLVDWGRARDAFVDEETHYLLSAREIFARFFDQYARLYWNQLGRPYGPNIRPGDLDPHLLAAQVPTFHAALLEAQVIDAGHLETFSKDGYLEETVGALAVATALFAVGVPLISPPK